jgi:hypothetical protein
MSAQEEKADEAERSRRKSEDPVARTLRLEKEARELKSSLDNGIISDLKTRVAWILNLFPHTRNSDVALTIKYWEMFQPDIFNPRAMAPTDLFKLERESYIVRVRAKIQNEYNLFSADNDIKRHRRSREEDMRDAVIEDKPERNLVFVFADETGKTAEFVCVAAVWVLTGRTLFRASQAISAWQETSPWSNREIHFTEFKKHHQLGLDEYLALVKQHREFLSFKVIAIERAKSRRPVEEIVQRLHEYMMIRGAAHEIRSGRLKLPHEVRLTVDAEQSLDVIACADIKSRVADAFKSTYSDYLTIDEVSAVSSHKSPMVQLADVIAGAVNRRLNHKGERGHKDEMADRIIDSLDLQLKQDDIPGVDTSAWLSI